MGVHPRAGGGSAEWDLTEPRERIAHPRRSLSHLRRVAAELLAERDRDGIHPMRAAGLDDVVELDRLRGERVAEAVERGEEVVDDLVERREMNRRRKDVVRRLAHVDVVVR